MVLQRLHVEVAAFDVDVVDVPVKIDVKGVFLLVKIDVKVLNLLVQIDIDVAAVVTILIDLRVGMILALVHDA